MVFKAYTLEPLPDGHRHRQSDEPSRRDLFGKAGAAVLGLSLRPTANAAAEPARDTVRISQSGVAVRKFEAAQRRRFTP